MSNAASSTLKVTTPSDREIVIVRAFDAPRDLVFDGRPERRNRMTG